VTGVDEVCPGEYRNIDGYVRELREAGFEADYENVWSGGSGFTAVLSVEDVRHAVIEGGTTGHLVRDVENSLSSIVSG
jgi:hypothetical protein